MTDEQPHIAIACSPEEWAQLVHYASLLLLYFVDAEMEENRDGLDRLTFERVHKVALEQAIHAMGGHEGALKVVEEAGLHQQRKEAQQLGRIN